MRATLPLALLVLAPAVVQAQTVSPGASPADTAAAPSSRAALFPPLVFREPATDSLRLDLARDRWDDARQGAVVGALSGALHGAFLTRVEQPCERNGGSYGASPTSGAAAGALLGAVQGAFLGWTGRKRQAAPPSSTGPAGTTVSEPPAFPPVSPTPQCTADGRIPPVP